MASKLLSGALVSSGVLALVGFFNFLTPTIGATANGVILGLGVAGILGSIVGMVYRK